MKNKIKQNILCVGAHYISISLHVVVVVVDVVVIVVSKQSGWMDGWIYTLTNTAQKTKLEQTNDGCPEMKERKKDN